MCVLCIDVCMHCVSPFRYFLCSCVSSDVLADIRAKKYRIACYQLHCYNCTMILDFFFENRIFEHTLLAMQGRVKIGDGLLFSSVIWELCI